MAKGVTELLLKISGDNREAVQALKGIEGQLQKTESGFRSSMKKIGAALVAAGVASWGKEAFQAAVDAEEAASKFKTVFGPAVEEAGEFVDDYANRLGLASFELEGVMGTIAAILQGLGTTVDDSAQLTEDIIQIGCDLASFHNLPFERAIGAIQSALAGEREALKGFGIIITENDVIRQAMIDTGKTVRGDVDKTEKAMATIKLIYEQAGVAVGDLDRTHESTANQMRERTGRMKDVQADFGEAIGKIFGAIEPVLSPVIELIGAVADAVGAVVDFVVDGPFVRFGDLIGEQFNPSGRAAENLRDDLEDLRGKLGELSGSELQEAIADFSKYEVRIGESSTALQDLQTELGLSDEAFAENIEAVLAHKDEMGLNKDRVGELRDELDRLARNTLETRIEDAYRNGIETMNDYRAAMDGNFSRASEIAQEKLVDEMAVYLADLDMAAINNTLEFMNWSNSLEETLAETVGLFKSGTDEIETSVEEMLSNIAGQVERNRRFQAALEELARRGLGDLVAELESVGPTAAAAAADFVANPIEAALASMGLGQITVAELQSVNDAIRTSRGPLSSEVFQVANAMGLTWDAELRTFSFQAATNSVNRDQSFVTSARNTTQRAVNAARSTWNSWNPQGKSGNFYVNTYYTTTYSTHNQPGFADGGITPGGPVWVGERGAELVDLPKGSRVHSNPDSRRIASGGLGGGDVTVNVAGSVISERDLVEAVREGLDRTALRNGSTGLN